MVSSAAPPSMAARVIAAICSNIPWPRKRASSSMPSMALSVESQSRKRSRQEKSVALMGGRRQMVVNHPCKVGGGHSGGVHHNPLRNRIRMILQNRRLNSGSIHGKMFDRETPLGVTAKFPLPAVMRLDGPLDLDARGKTPLNQKGGKLFRALARGKRRPTNAGDSGDGSGSSVRHRERRVEDLRKGTAPAREQGIRAPRQHCPRHGKDPNPRHQSTPTDETRRS